MYTSVKEMIEIFKEGAKINFNHYGYLTPIFSSIIDGEPYVCALKFDTKEDKDKFSKWIIEMIQNDRLKEFIMVNEAWAVETKDQKNLINWMQTNDLKDHPDAYEIAIVNYCGPTEEIQCTARILRDTITTLSEWQISKQPVKFSLDSFTSRFQGLFLKSKSHLN
jgi:hypothetical protein